MSNLLPFRTPVPGGFEDLRDEMDSLMNRFFGRNLPRENGGEQATWFSPPINVAETDGEFEIAVDLPAMRPEDFNIEFRQGDLWITGYRRHNAEEKGRTWHRIERRYGEFRRVLRLGNAVDADKVEAEYRDGVLRIRVPKAATAKSRKIEVKS
jgi:HSP20 family protein